MSIHRFQIESLGRRATRSCSVVRSIMTDSRSVDPGSNPGTSIPRAFWPMNPSSHVDANSLSTRALPSSLEDDEMHHSVNAVILPSSVL